MSDHPNWKALSTVDFSWKRFVREGTKESNKSAQSFLYKPNSMHALTGDEAKQIYDDVVYFGQNRHIDQCQNEGLALPKGESRKSTGTVKARRTSDSPGGMASSVRLGVEEGNIGALSSTSNPETTTAILDHFHLQDYSRPTRKEKKDSKVDLSICAEQYSLKHYVKAGIGLGPPVLGITAQTFPDNSAIEAEHTSTSMFPKYVPNSSVLNSVMKEVEKNNIETVQKYIEDGMDINAVDKFGWTMLMVAACAGASGVVKLLLQCRANVRAKDKSGSSCRSLARRNGHLHIVEILDSYKLTKDTCDYENESRSQNKVSLIEDFYCHTCMRNFCETTREKHMSSTVHLFNSRPQSFGTIYGIPESNVGYQLLLKRGWDKESGLGRDGTGQKFPCKTVLKRDRKGFGVQQPKPRITHFEPKEEAAIRHVHCHKPKPSNKKALAKSINLEKLTERKLRNQLS